MAERRMFAKTIIDSDAFLDMPLSAQALYFHLSMRADDDGFLNNAKKIMRIINANQNDYDLLIAKAFVIQFDDGICVIKHWRINNYLRSDRYKPTIYQEQKQMLEVKENGRYSLKNDDGIPIGIPQVDQCETQFRLGKDSIGKDSIGKDNNFCEVPNEVAPSQDANIYADVPSIPLNDGTEWKMTKELYEEYVKAYPALNVKQEISQMRIWCLSSPANKKTKKGVTRFVNGWLGRSQNVASRRKLTNQFGAENLIV